jgi:hypothetical protein
MEMELKRIGDKSKKVHNHRWSLGERRGRMKRWKKKRKRRSKICGGEACVDLWCAENVT